MDCIVIWLIIYGSKVFPLIETNDMSQFFAITGMHYMNDLSTANVLRQIGEKLLRYLGSK